MEQDSVFPNVDELVLSEQAKYFSIYWFVGLIHKKLKPVDSWLDPVLNLWPKKADNLLSTNSLSYKDLSFVL